MRAPAIIALCIATSIATSAATIGLTNPVGHTDVAQKAIVDEFVQLYCHPDRSKEVGFLIGGAAALSRVSIRAGLGTIALAEYAKCKVGV